MATDADFESLVHDLGWHGYMNDFACRCIEAGAVPSRDAGVDGYLAIGDLRCIRGNHSREEKITVGRTDFRRLFPMPEFKVKCQRKTAERVVGTQRIGGARKSGGVLG